MFSIISSLLFWFSFYQLQYHSTTNNICAAVSNTGSVLSRNRGTGMQIKFGAVDFKGSLDCLRGDQIIRYACNVKITTLLQFYHSFCICKCRENTSSLGKESSRSSQASNSMIKIPPEC